MIMLARRNRTALQVRVVYEGTLNQHWFVTHALTYHLCVCLRLPNLELANEADHGNRRHCEDNLNVRFCLRNTK